MRVRRPAPERPDELNILSSVWILSCTDPSPLMTYEGMRRRLGLPDGYDLRGLVSQRGEMFRAGIPARRLEKLRPEMLAGKSLPGWLKAVEDEDERRRLISALTPDDFFCNQFRVDPNPPRASDEILSWGLETIDRLRKGRADAREEARKSWSTITLPAIAMIFSLFTGATNFFILWLGIEQQGAFQVMQFQSRSREIGVQGYASELRAKQEAYGRFMTSLANASRDVEARDRAALAAALGVAEVAYYEIEPFLEARRGEEILSRYLEFAELCRQAVGAEETPPDFSAKATEYRRAFVEDLHQSLFSDKYR
jgi:hypothetical protein